MFGESDEYQPALQHSKWADFASGRAAGDGRRGKRLGKRAKQDLGIVGDREKRDDVLKIFGAKFVAGGVHRMPRRGVGTRHHANAARRARRFVFFGHDGHALA